MWLSGLSRSPARILNPLLHIPPLFASPFSVFQLSYQLKQKSPKNILKKTKQNKNYMSQHEKDVICSALRCVHSDITLLFSPAGYSTGHSRCSSLTDLSHHRNASSSSSTSCGAAHPAQPPPSTPTEHHRQATPTKPERPPPPSAAALMSNRSSRWAHTSVLVYSRG